MASDYMSLIDYDRDHLKDEYKGFGMERSTDLMLWKITAQPTGNRCPNALGGHWTNIELLKNAIDHYLASKNGKENAKNNSKD